jgi:cytochrome c556
MTLRSTALLLALFTTSASPVGLATDTAAPELELRAIMRQLGEDVARIGAGIAREDWPQVAAAARRVADHPQPGLLEKTRVLAFIGTAAPRFRGHDQATHTAALRLADAAAAGDGNAAIHAYADVLQGCHACHAQFRRDFVRHFYPQETTGAGAATPPR